MFCLKRISLSNLSYKSEKENVADNFLKLLQDNLDEI